MATPDYSWVPKGSRECLEDAYCEGESTDVIEEIIAGGIRICKSGSSRGFVLPFDNDAEQDWNQGLRAFFYIVLLVWVFLGVAVASDAFMNGIEKITSQKVRVAHPSQKDRTVTVAVWNDTVANLTLMAFGSSTPEILLSLIELCGNKMFSGELGASTIVGSAAFNLLIIMSICIATISSDEVRMIKDTTVYYVTVVFSLFAYFWLYFVLDINGENYVDFAEAFITLLLFPVLCVLAYGADKGWFSSADSAAMETKVAFGEGLEPEDIEEYARNIQKKFGKDLPMDKVLRLLEQDMAPKKTRATYRSGAIRQMTGKGKAVLPHGTASSSLAPSQSAGNASTHASRGEGDKYDPAKLESNAAEGAGKNGGKVPEIFWDVLGDQLLCLECCGSIRIPVKCMPHNNTATITYKTREGTAKETTEYLPKEGTLTFPPSTEEEVQFVEIDIVDDEIYEDDTEFFVDMMNEEGSCEVVGGVLSVIVIDDDDPGTVGFKYEVITVKPNAESVDVPIIRRNGANGKVSVHLKTEDATAIADTDFEGIDDDLSFEHEELEATVTIHFAAAGPARIRKDIEFRVVMTAPTGGAKLNETTDGGAEACICTIVFSESEEGKDLLRKAKSRLSNNLEMMRLTAKGKYKEQFMEALYVNGSPEEQKDATVGDWVLHLVMLVWKLLCATVPPVEWQNGWLTFTVSLLYIAGLTALVADVAETIGCCMNLPDLITAITLVAFGTSVPDTLASRTAAIQDEYADSSVTNVTGSNSVNVFLGLGLPWSIGTIYWAVEGVTLEWKLRISALHDGDGYQNIVKKYPDGGLIHSGANLGFSVLVFSICALFALLCLHLRRVYIGGEFGGNAKVKWGSSIFMFGLWCIYIALSSWWALKDD
jgi:solute carrier family 8 (sodium/calcium exchanger)